MSINAGRMASGSKLDWRPQGARPKTFKLAGQPDDYLTLLDQLFDDAHEIQELRRKRKISDSTTPYQRVYRLPAIPLHWIARTSVKVEVIDYRDEAALDDRDIHWETGAPYPHYLNVMAAGMKRGEHFPPIVTLGTDILRGVTRIPFDGRHRLNAALRLNLREVPALFLDELYLIGLES